MDTNIYKLSQIYYKDKYIDCISEYFNISISHIESDTTIHENFLNTREKIKNMYMEKNNISKFTEYKPAEVLNILELVKSNDDESITLGLDLFFRGWFGGNKESYELLHFLNTSALHNTLSDFYIKFNVFIYILDTGDALNYRVIDYYKISKIIKNYK